MIVKATEQDIVKISELEKESFLIPWSIEQYRTELNGNEFSHLLVYKEDKEILGYIDFWILFDQATINKIAVKKEVRNQGIAKALLKEALKYMAEAECFICTLEVRVSNIAAINLYTKFGFETALVKKQYYSDGEDANYMIKGVGNEYEG